jgi:hypothetical protein
MRVCGVLVFHYSLLFSFVQSFCARVPQRDWYFHVLLSIYLQMPVREEMGCLEQKAGKAWRHS